MANQLPGKRAFVVLARLSDGDQIASEPVEALLPYRVELLPITDGPLPATGKFPLHIKADPDLKIKQVEYFVDGSLLRATDNTPSSDVALNAARLTPGDHTLHAVVTTKTGERYLTPALVVTATKPGRNKNTINHEQDPDNDEESALPPPDPNKEGLDLSAWQLRFQEYIDGQSRSLGAVGNVLRNRYEGTASVDEAIATVNKELAFARPRKFIVAQMSISGVRTEEDERTLKKAQRQLSQSFIKSVQALRWELNALLSLRHYDGNPDNAPADVLSSLRNMSAQASRALLEATRLKEQAQYNLNLVERRNNRRN